MVRLSARTGGSKFSHHACANSFMASSCSTFVREGTCVVKYCSSCDFLAVKMVFSCLELTTETGIFHLVLVMPFNVSRQSGVFPGERPVAVITPSFICVLLWCMDLEMRPDSGCVCTTTKLSQWRESHEFLGILFPQIRVWNRFESLSRRYYYRNRWNRRTRFVDWHRTSRLFAYIEILDIRPPPQKYWNNYVMP